ncbi:MAG: hypothetical protein IRZ09_13655 [Variibacter sp.]|nr:hypothetical protein [Variibacter sp.]
MKDFWLSSGHHLVDRDEGGGLVATDDLIRAYLARPELAPPPEACPAERALHAALLAEPRRRVSRDDIGRLADADARENWEVMIAFRNHLLRHRTLEAAYLAFAREGAGRTPPLFINQLVHLILRNALDGCADAFMLRAAELFFRPQILTFHEGSLIAADEEIVNSAGGGPPSPLAAMLGLPAFGGIDVLGEANAESYFDRSDRFDMALDLTAGRRGLAALAEVIAIWVRHMLAVEVAVEPLTEVRDARLNWYVGLDAEGTRIGDRLWHGEELDSATLSRIVGLFALTFRDAHVARAVLEGQPVYLLLAMTEGRALRMKPQNLLVGLPLSVEAVS